jgi:AhpD family alkylhydroperoxidase
MSRIEGVPERQASLVVRLIYRLVGHELAKMTGQRGRLTGDIPIRAHRPGLLVGYGLLEKAVASRPRVEQRLRALAALKSAVMQGCEMCQDIGSHEARAAGIADEQLLDLYRYRDSEHFDQTERLVLDLAVGMTVTPINVSDELFAALRERFDDGQLVELVNLIAVENLRSRFNGALAIGSTGFSEGMVCARMEPAPVTADDPPRSAPEQDSAQTAFSLAGAPPGA